MRRFVLALTPLVAVGLAAVPASAVTDRDCGARQDVARRHHRLKAALVSLTLLVPAMTLAIASPAHASGSSVWVRDGVMYGECFHHQVSFSIDPKLANELWHLSVHAEGPNGSWPTNAFPSPFKYGSSGTTKGSDGLYFCGITARPGTYTVQAEVNYLDRDIPDEVLPTTTFRMYRARTQTRMTVNDRTARFNQILRFRVQVLGQSPKGYSPPRYGGVLFQTRSPRGHWHYVTQKTVPDRHPLVFRIRWNTKRPMQARAVMNAARPYMASHSHTITIR